jgi:adenine/guanine phosphoribosyltransferase-like PRPP-binding protein/ubiquinone/menaquinone biosynthesis C-methylase UbiE
MNDTPRPICDYEGSDYQDSFWGEGDRAYEDRVEAIALSRLLPATGERLLEVGAGAGRNTPRYAGFRQVVLVDYSRSMLAQARQRLGESDRWLFVAADAYRLPFAPGVFDAATMIRVLHHMVDPLAALRRLRSVLRPSAAFVLEYANKRNVKAIARWLLGRQVWNPFDRAAVEFAPLNFDFHPAAVGEWLEQAGFARQRQLTVSHFRQATLKRLVPIGMLVALDSAAQWTGGLWQLSPSVFVRARAIGGLGESSDAFWLCPACDSPGLHPTDEGLRCHACGAKWPQVDGIYDLRLPQAPADSARSGQAISPAGRRGRVLRDAPESGGTIITPASSLPDLESSMLPERHTHTVHLAGLERQLPLFEIAPGVRIAVLNILGDTELVEACARALAGRLEGIAFDLLVTAEAKSIPLAHAMAVVLGKRYVVLRKTYKPYMGEPVKAETLSITTGKPQTLILDEKDRQLVEGKRVVIVDDVVSTGSTLEGMRKVMNLAGAQVVAEAAVFTEGDPEEWTSILALGHLPIFKDG